MLFKLFLLIKLININTALNEMMTTHFKNPHKIVSLASKVAKSMTPFFFIKRNQQRLAFEQQKLTLKMNRQMSPFLQNLPSNIRLGFWSLAQVQMFDNSPQTFKNSIVLNLYKTQRLIQNCLMKGIRKMLVDDIQQLQKIQQCYFKIRKNGIKVDEPEYIWSVQNQNNDIQNIINLQQCQIPLKGFYFTGQMCMGQIKNILENKKIQQKNFENFREIKMQNLDSEINFLNQKNIEPMISNYSQTNNYYMVCRVIGRDKQGKPIFENICSDFICKGDLCSCGKPNAKIINTFKTQNQQWAIVEPARLDKLQLQHVLQ